MQQYHSVGEWKTATMELKHMVPITTTHLIARMNRLVNVVKSTEGGLITYY